MYIFLHVRARARLVHWPLHKVKSLRTGNFLKQDMCCWIILLKIKTFRGLHTGVATGWFLQLLNSGKAELTGFMTGYFSPERKMGIGRLNGCHLNVRM